jgi:hypothetical protein
MTQGARQGGGQGVREFSLVASLVKLPGLSSGNESQEGNPRGVLDAQIRPLSGVSEPLDSAPSLPPGRGPPFCQHLPRVARRQEGG